MMKESSPHYLGSIFDGYSIEIPKEVIVQLLVRAVQKK
jgi:hypothetical protein